ncbi:MAG: 3-phosphoshikimate 1-carboxyvinyltransferase [Chitinophagaceae bacterium]|nr:MAG: 3-phosphoshikimate 1-carboxyvinyltransferase [Chitinophagaceae bacterium]
MQITISPSFLKGTITAPASKSAMQRACAAALLKKGQTILQNPGVSDDDLAALKIIQQLGAVVEKDGGQIVIESKGVQPVSDEINCGESGLSSRMFTSIAAVSEKSISVTGKGSLVKRPFSFFTEVDLTLQVMQDFGLPVPVNNNYASFYFSDKGVEPSSKSSFTYAVEGDWSGGAFLLVAGAIAVDLVVRGLNVFSTQADKNILGALMQSGANISIEEKQIHVRRGKLKAFHFNATDCPDLFPPLVALAAYCEGTSVIEGVHRLTHKESNRALTLQEEFAKMGVTIELQDDLMIIRGGNKVVGANVHSRHDHRVAMACAVAALGADGPTTIDEAEAVNKSYPQFWEHLHSLTPA